MKPLDQRNTEIRDARAKLLMHNCINVGDFVRFTDGTTRRVSYIWRDEEERLFGIQTSDSGSFYLSDGYVSFSGSLKRSVPYESLEDTGDTHDGEVWFFDHDWHRAHAGVPCMVKFRVWHCSQEAPE